jgi:hypothetical protein
MVTLDGPVLDRLIEMARSKDQGPVALAAQLIVEGLDRMGAPAVDRAAMKGKKHG